MNSQDHLLNIEIAGIRRQLPVEKIEGKYRPHLQLLTDVQLTNVSAGVLAPQLTKLNWDILVGTTIETIPLLHMLSSFLGRDHYALCLSDQNRPDNSNGCDHAVDSEFAELLTGKQLVTVQPLAIASKTAEKLTSSLQRTDVRLMAKAAVLVSEEIEDEYIYAETFSDKQITSSS